MIKLQQKLGSLFFVPPCIFHSISQSTRVQSCANRTQQQLNSQDGILVIRNYCNCHQSAMQQCKTQDRLSSSASWNINGHTCSVTTTASLHNDQTSWDIPTQHDSRRHTGPVHVNIKHIIHCRPTSSKYFIFKVYFKNEHSDAAYGEPGKFAIFLPIYSSNFQKISLWSWHYSLLY